MGTNFNFLNSKVARRVTSQFLLVALIPIAATAILSFTYITDLLVENSQTKLHQASKYYGIGLLDRILFIEDKLRNVSIGLQSEQLNAENYRKHFSRELKTLVIVNSTGEIKTLFGDKNTIPNILNKITSKNRTQVLFSKSNDHYSSIFVSIQINHLQLDAINLVAEINPEYLWGSNESLANSTNICVYNNSNQLLFCSSENLNPLVAIQHNSKQRKIAQHFEWKNGDDEYLASSWQLFLQSHFNSENLTIIASEVKDHALLPIKTFNKIFPSVIFLSLLITVFLSISQIRRSMVPLEKLISGIRSVSNHDFSHKIVVESKDEFQELAVSFNTMTRQLSKQFNALTTLSEIDHHILSNPDIEYVIKIILKRLHIIISIDFVSISILDLENSNAAQSYLYNDPEHGYNPPDIEQTIFTKEDFKLLLSNQYYKYIDIKKGKVKFLDHLSKRGAVYACSLPIIYKNRIIAVINLGFKEYSDLINDDLIQVRDIADRLAVALATSERDKKLYHQAHFDALTKLPNRELFADRLNQEIIHAHREQHKIALLFIDLDRFKQVNDTLGHSVGDKLLQHTATRLSTCIRNTDTVARLGGDEFTLTISNIKEPKDASYIAENAIKQLAESLIINGHELFINSSIGISIYPDDGTTVEELLRNADAAMYRAKDKGRGRYQFFEEKMNVEDLKRTKIEHDLRFAIERNELELRYQPQIDLVTGKVIGAEALIRWNHPERGSINPQEFISIAEDTGLIEPIGEWVLHTACKQFSEWKDKNLGLSSIAVNVSSRQFLQQDFVAMVNSILVKTDVSAKNLEIEITESVLMEDRIDTLAILNNLSAMGVSLSIDDFGTGYSSLSYLKRLPVDTLKIDQSFMEGIPSDENAIAISASIIALAHTLNKKVIAEGIETVEQLSMLRSKKCDVGQGFFFNKALLALDFEAYLSEKSPFLKIIN